MGEGDTPLIPAPQLSSLTGADVFLKLEGANPTGSFKDRGMTVAVSAAIGEGAEAVICASTGNTAASAAAYAARAGLRGAVIVPEGKIATGKLAQALMHGARVIALRGNFDEALALVRELADRHPIALVNSVNDYRIEGQKTGAFEVCDQLGEAPDVLCIPVGNAGNVTSWWKGFQEYGTAPRMHGYQAEGAAPLVHGAPVENPETVASAIRIGNPARWEDAMNAFTASRGEVRAVSDAEILDAYSLLGAREGVFCEPASAASVAGLLKYGAEGRVVCVLTGHGLKDPQTAMNRAASVVPCEPDIESVERAVMGSAMKRRRLVRVPASSANLGPGYDVLAAALSLHLELEVEETGEFLVRLLPPRHPHRPQQPLRARVRAPALRRRRDVPDPLGDPGRRGPRLERSGDRGGAGRGRPHVRAGRAALRAGRGAGGPPGQRGRGAPRRVRDLPGRRRGAGAVRPAGRARGRARDSRPRGADQRGARGDAGRGAAGGGRRTTSDTRRCWCSGSRRTTSA